MEMDPIRRGRREAQRLENEAYRARRPERTRARSYAKADYFEDLHQTRFLAVPNEPKHLDFRQSRRDRLQPQMQQLYPPGSFILLRRPREPDALPRIVTVRAYFPIMPGQRTGRIVLQ